MDWLDIARFALGTGVLGYGAWADWRTRRVANRTWMLAGGAALLLLAADLWRARDPWPNTALVAASAVLFYNAFIDEYEFDARLRWGWRGAQALGVAAFAGAVWASDYDGWTADGNRRLHLAAVPVLMAMMFAFYYLGLMAGGADAKGVMTVALVMPFYPALRDGLWVASDDWSLPFPWVVFMNSLLCYLVIPQVLLAWNVAHRDLERPWLQALIGYRLSLTEARARFVWPMQQVVGDRVVLTAFVRRGAREDEQWDALAEAGVTRPWVTPKTPYLIPLLLAFVLTVFVGDVFSWLTAPLFGA